MATPSQLKGMTQAGVDALNRLNAYKAAQAAATPQPGSPMFTGPAKPPAAAPQGVLSRIGGAISSGVRTAGGVVGRGLATVGTKALGIGVGSALYPSELGDGTLSSPEAQRAIAENEKIRRNSGNPLIANEPSTGFVNSLIKPASDKITSPSSPNIISRPEGTANLQPNTGTVELPPVGTPQQIEKERIARIAGRISTENPYGADVTSPALRTGQIRVGASTDAEAARNLQSRAEQDAAAANRVASYDRATESLRDLRAGRMGIPRSVLDVSEGRASPAAQAAPERNPFALPGDAFGDDVMRRNKLMSAIENPGGKTPGEKKRNQLAAVETFKAFMEGGQQPARAANGINPIDMGRFLLDQQKATAQLGIDKARLGIEQGTLESKRAETGLKQQEYSDKAKQAFMETASIDVPPEYQPQILSSVYQMSQATKGAIPPEVMASEYMNFAKQQGVDFKDVTPKDMLKFNEQFMASITSRYGSK